MDKQKIFMGLLTDIVEIARVNDNSITTEEIDDYFSEINLDDKQLEYVYEYLYKSNITVKGYVNGIKKKSSDDSVGLQSGIVESSVRIKQYRKNVKELEPAAPDVLEKACVAVLNGYANDAEKNIVIENHLAIVLNKAKQYANRGVSSDELIQEGNLALVMGVNELNSLGTCDNDNPVKKCRNYLEEYIKRAIVEFVDKSNEEESDMYATVAKAGLVNEAVKTLATEYGRIATLSELSEFTHISEEEIMDIVRMSGNKIEIGKG